MYKSIEFHEGKKYLRVIHSSVTGDCIQVDVYDVLHAFNVTRAPVAHCLKKLLAPGQRGKGTELQDLEGALAALCRAIDQCRLDMQLQEMEEAATELEAKEEYTKQESNHSSLGREVPF